MIVIAHRGNTNGTNPDKENTLLYLEEAYNKGFDVEVDLIGINGILYFGHDEPQEVACTNFIQRNGVWCHAKNTHAIELLADLRANYFWHENDAATVTSKGFIWCYPGHFVNSKKAIWLDLFDTDLPAYDHVYGICTDKGEQY